MVRLRFVAFGEETEFVTAALTGAEPAHHLRSCFQTNELNKTPMDSDAQLTEVDVKSDWVLVCKQGLGVCLSMQDYKSTSSGHGTIYDVVANSQTHRYTQMQSVQLGCFRIG